MIYFLVTYASSILGTNHRSIKTEAMEVRSKVELYGKLTIAGKCPLLIQQLEKKEYDEILAAHRIRSIQN